MLRIIVLCRVASTMGFVATEQQDLLIDEYKRAITQNPTLPFIKWAVQAGKLTPEQSKVVKESYPRVPLRCVSCDNQFRAGDCDIRKPIACPNCGSTEILVPDRELRSVLGAPASGDELPGLGGSASQLTVSVPSAGGDVLSAADLRGQRTGGGPGAGPIVRTAVQAEPVGSSNALPSMQGAQSSPMAQPSVQEVLTGSSHAGSMASGGSGSSLASLGADDGDSYNVIPPGAVIGGCRVIQKVGQGGMGAVYKAHHLALDKTIALKVLAPHLVENRAQILRFIREARSAAKLEHENIVGVLNVGEENRRFYLVMQWVDGESLQRRLDREGRIPIEEALEYILAAARGLGEAHKYGIIHRDVKPDNFMLTEQNRLKVADFGLAKQQESDLEVSQSGVILGTPYYMSPEQGQNVGVDHRTDIYSLGITLYHILTGKLPFTGPSAVSIIFKHVKEPMAPARSHNAQIPPDLDDLILKMTAKEQDARPQTMDEVITKLTKIRDRIAKHGVPTGPLGRTVAITGSGMPPTMAVDQRDLETAGATSSKRGLQLAVVAFVLLVATIGGAWAYYDRYLRPSQDPATVASVNGEPRTADNSSGSGNGSDGGNEISGANNSGESNNGANGGDNVNQNSNTGNGGNTGNVNNNQGDTQEDARARAALSSLEAEIARDPQEYSRHLNQLQQLADRYKHTRIAPEINRRLTEIRDTQKTQAAAYWDRIAPDYTAFNKARQFVDAQALLQAFPANFAGTPTYADVQSKLQTLRPLAEHEREAGRALSELDVALQALDPDFSAIEFRWKILKDEYLDTRFENRIKNVGERIAARKLDMNQRREAEIIGNLRRDVRSQYLSASNYQGAVDFLNDSRQLLTDAEGNDLTPETERKFQELVKSVTDEAEARFKRDMTTFQQHVDNARWEDARKVLDGIGYPFGASGYGLDDQRKEAERRRDALKVYSAVLQLDDFEKGKRYADGLQRCNEWLADPTYTSVEPLLKWFQERFECFVAGMVYIPAQTVTMPFTNESVVVPAFFIDTFEITNAQYLEFIQAGGYKADSGFWDHLPEGESLDKYTVLGGADHGPRYWRGRQYAEGEGALPVTGITLYEAMAYAAWRGNTVPDKLTWRVAAGYDPRTRKFYRFPWGDDFQPAGKPFPANLYRERVEMKLAEVRDERFAVDISAFGVRGMGGNVREWTRSLVEGRPDQYTICGGAYSTQRDVEQSAMVFPAKLQGADWVPATDTFNNGARPDRSTGFRTCRIAPPRPQ